MKKRYLILVLIAGFALIFLMLINHATAPTVRDTDQIAEDALRPEAAPAQKDDLIVVSYPLPQGSVASPLLVKGRARGSWFFEGSFPMTLTDLNGVVLANGYASAQGEWMTSEYVPFTGTLTYEITPEQKGSRALLILRKDNPSDDRTLDNALTIPVIL